MAHGSQVALINPETHVELNYTEVLSFVERVARGLVKLGLEPGLPLCFFAPNCVEIVLTILATWSIGASVQPTNPASMPGELRRHLDISEANIIVTVPEILPTVMEAAAGLNKLIVIIGPRDGHLNFEDLLTLGTEDVTLPPPPADPSQTVASLLFSSGTTGLPKAVEMTQTNILAWVALYSHIPLPSLDTSDTLILHLPLFHAYGQVVTLSAAVACGCRMVVLCKFQLDTFLGLVTKYKATALLTVPPIIIGMVNHPRLSDFDLSSVRFLTSAAAPLGPETMDQFVKKTGIPILQAWGMTENMVTTFSTLDNVRRGSSGRPIPNVDCKVVDPETGRTLAVGEVGEICMRGPVVMRGYHKNPEATRLTIDRYGWMHTGDMGRFDSDGFVYVLDRLKELIKFKGEQVPPAMLEDVLLAHPEVDDACVIGLPDPLAGELPRAYVVRAEGSQVTEQEVKEFVAKRVPSYMQLRGGVEFIPQIPKSPSGKILRRLLRDELRQRNKAKL